MMRVYINSGKRVCRKSILKSMLSKYLIKWKRNEKVVLERHKRGRVTRYAAKRALVFALKPILPHTYPAKT